MCYHVVQHIWTVKLQSEWQSIPRIWAAEIKIGTKQRSTARAAALDLLLYFALLLICFRTDTVLAVVRVTRMATAAAYFGSSVSEEIRVLQR